MNSKHKTLISYHSIIEIKTDFNDRFEISKKMNSKDDCLKSKVVMCMTGLKHTVNELKRL